MEAPDVSWKMLRVRVGKSLKMGVSEDKRLAKEVRASRCCCRNAPGSCWVAEAEVRERNSLIPPCSSVTYVRSCPGFESQYDGVSLISFVCGGLNSELELYARLARIADWRFCWRSRVEVTLSVPLLTPGMPFNVCMPYSRRKPYHRRKSRIQVWISPSRSLMETSLGTHPLQTQEKRQRKEQIARSPSHLLFSHHACH